MDKDNSQEHTDIKKHPLWFSIAFAILLLVIIVFSIRILLLTPLNDCIDISSDINVNNGKKLIIHPPVRLNDNTKDVGKSDGVAPSNESRCQLPKNLLKETPTEERLPFQRWLDSTREDMFRHGISNERFDEIFQGVQPIKKILVQDSQQAEYSKPFSEYLHNQISTRRIKKGKQLLNTHKKLLVQLEKKYSVQPQILVALWAMESNFGEGMGSYSGINALATLAYDGRRYQFFQNELRCALQIIKERHITSKQMKSSWAGAMGQVQFMPSTFIHYSADGDGDGKKDIWNNPADALASAANYLNLIGWKAQHPWGFEVKLPKDFDFYNARFSDKRSINEWYDLGVKLANNKELPFNEVKGAIILPSGSKGPAFLVLHNFTIIKEWNRSMFYALAVAHLSDRLIGKSSLVIKPPRNEKRISNKQAKSLQTNLKDLGFYHGNIDGMLGLKSYQAIRDYQRRKNIKADAYPSSRLISKINEEASR